MGYTSGVEPTLYIASHEHHVGAVRPHYAGSMCFWLGLSVCALFWNFFSAPEWNHETIFIKIIRKQKPPSESKKNTKTIIGSRLFRGHYTFRVWDEDQWFTNSLQFQCGRGRARIAQLVKAWICNLRIVGSCVTASEVLAFSKPLTPNC